MTAWKKLFGGLALATAALVLSPARTAPAQVSVGINIGAAPACPYGYYGYAPYNCAPYGYYGPEWFSSGVFIGAGPWWHGGDHFYGSVNRAYDPRFGYHGPYPGHDERFDNAHDWHDFHGNGYHDFHGNEAPQGYRPH